MGAENLLSRLEDVKSTGRGRWIARCPAHDDGNPSLSIRELDDGKVLLHCFSGCSVDEILGAIGLSRSDLFPEKALGHHTKLERRPFPAADILRCLAFEVFVVLSFAASLKSCIALTESDYERLTVAGERILGALDAGGLNHA
jgi:hypothetical protein